MKQANLNDTKHRQPRVRTVLVAAVGVLALSATAAVLALAPMEPQAGPRGGRLAIDDDRRPLLRLGGGAGRLDASVRDIAASEAEASGLPTQAGVIITSVRPEGAADAAGLQQGDILMEFDAIPVRSARQLARVVSETSVGRSVRAVAWRAGQRVEVPIELRSRSGFDFDHLDAMLGRFDVTMPDVRLPDMDIDVRLGPGRLGVGVQALGDQLAGYFGVEHGVLVTSVRDGSPASLAGIAAGDVITAVDGGRIDSVSDLRRAVDRAGTAATVDVVRDHEFRSVSVELGRGDRQSRGRPI